MQRPKILLIGVLAGVIVLSGSPGAPAGEAPGAERPERPRTVLIVASADLLDPVHLQSGDAARATGRFLVNALELLASPSEVLDIECAAPSRKVVRKETEKLEDTLRRGVLLLAKKYLEQSDPRLKDGFGEDDEGFLEEVAAKTAADTVQRLERRWPAEVAEVQVSPSMAQLLQSVREPIRVTYYVSGERPAGLEEVVHYTTDYLRELSRLSRGNLSVQVVAPEDEASRYAAAEVETYLATRARGETPEEPVSPPSPMELFGGRPSVLPEERRRNRESRSREIARQSGREYEEVYAELLSEDFREAYLKQLENQGIQGVVASPPEGGGRGPREIFSSITLSTGPRRVEVVPHILDLETLELRVATTLVKLLRTEKPRLILADLSRAQADEATASPPGPFGPSTRRAPSRLAPIAGVLEDRYAVRLFESAAGGALAEVLTEESRGAVDALIIARPERVEAKDVETIREAVQGGVPTILLVSPWSLDASQQGASRGLPLRSVQPGPEFGGLLKSWGVALGPGLLASRSCGSIPLPRQVSGMPRPMMVPTPLALLISLDGASLHPTSPFVHGGAGLCLPVSSGLELTGEPGGDALLRSTVLAWTPEDSWRVPLAPSEAGRPLLELEERDALLGADPETTPAPLEEPVPLIVLLRGD